MNTFKQLLLSSRPVSWLNTAFPFAATYVILTRNVDMFMVIGTLFFLIPYNLLMYGINDVFDYESDLQNPRKQGIEGIRLNKELHRTTIYTSVGLTLPFTLYLMVFSNVQAAWVLLLVLCNVIAYSAPGVRFKERPFIDSTSSSLHFVGPMLFALAVVGNFWLQALPFVIAFFLWGLGSHAFGSVQDVRADKAAGIGSVATVVGPRTAVLFSLTCYAACCLVLFGRYTWSATAVGLALTAYIINILPYANVSEAAAETTNKAWRRFIYLNYGCGALITAVLIVVFR